MVPWVELAHDQVWFHLSSREALGQTALLNETAPCGLADADRDRSWRLSSRGRDQGCSRHIAGGGRQKAVKGTRIRGGGG